MGAVLHQHAPGDCNHALRQSSGAVLSRSTRQTAHDFQLGGAHKVRAFTLGSVVLPLSQKPTHVLVAATIARRLGFTPYRQMSRTRQTAVFRIIVTALPVSICLVPDARPFYDGQHGDVDVTFISSGNSPSPNTPPATPIPRAQSAAETCSHLYRSHDGDTLTHADH